MNQIDRQSESLFHREKTRLQFYMANVYGWMSVSLLLTAFVSFYMIRNEKIIFFMSTNRWVLLVVFLVEIFLVNFLTSSVLRKIDGDSVTTLLMLYSLLTGITISLPLFIYTSFSIVSTFFISSIMFGSLSVYGYKTKTSLSAFSSFLFMSIVGIITASFLNMFGNTYFFWFGCVR